MDKVITMSEVFDKEVIRIYNRYLMIKIEKQMNLLLLKIWDIYLL